MNLLKKLFGRSATPTAVRAASGSVTAADDPFARLQWLPAEANPFAVAVLDCQPMVGGMPAMQEPEAAARFAALRSREGASLLEQRPEEATLIACALSLSFPIKVSDGALFRAEVMEDRWDVFLLEGWLYFVRSWSGQLVYRASVRFEPGRAFVRAIEAPREAAHDDAAFCLREVDYLIKSHVLDSMVPHPLPAQLARDSKQIALFSFSRHGRRGCFATYDDATAFDPVRWAAAGAHRRPRG